MSDFFDAVGDFFSSALDLVGDVFEAVGDLAEDVLDAVGDGLESIGNTISAILDDPLPTLLQIGGSFIGIPPYVTAAVITASKGGDLEDIAKSAAVSYASTTFIQGTEIGKTIGDFTKEVGADFTASMAENFNLPLDVASSVSKAATASLNSAIIGGVNAAISGRDVMDGITSGFTSGLIYSSTDSYFDSLNKDPNWGFSKTTLDLMKGASSTALNTLASGKGDPAQAVGNYITYATLKLGASELYKTAQKSFDEFTGAKDKAITAQDDYVKDKAEFDTKVSKFNSEASSLDTDVKSFDKYIDETFNPVKEKLDDLSAKQQEQIDIRENAVKSYEDNKWAYNNYDAKMRGDGYQIIGGDEYSSGYYAKIVGAKLEERYDGEYGHYKVWVPDGSIRDYEGNPIYQWIAGPTQDSFYQAAKKDVDVAKAATAKANEYGTQAKEYYDANKSVIDKVGEMKTSIEKKAETLATLKTDLETPNGSNAAQKLKDAADAYQKAYDTLSSKEGVANRAAENYNKIVAEIATRDATIDALNTGAIKVDGVNSDGSYTLSNGMTLKDGKFFQDGEQAFTNAGGIDQKDLSFKDNSGNTVMYNSSAGRLMSDSDIKQLFRRDYGYDLTDEQAKQFVGKDFNTVDTQKLQDIAIDRIEDEFRAITLRNPTAEEVNRIKDADNVVTAAQDAAINGLDLPADYVSPGASQQDKISFGQAYSAARAAYGPNATFEWNGKKYTTENKEEYANRTEREAAAAQARIDMMPAYGEAGAGRGSATGRPAGAENIYIDNKTGDVVIDDRKFDRYGNVISGSIKTAPETTALNVAKALFVDAGAQLTDAFAGAAKFLGLMDRNGETSRKVKQLSDYAESIKPAEVKAESQAFWDGLSKVKGIQDTVKYIAESVVDKPLMTGFNITSEIIQTLGTMGTGMGAKYAAKVLQAAPAIAAKLGVSVDMVLNVAESAGASYNDAYDRERKLLENYVKTGVMTKEEADLQAADKANKAFLTAGGITAAVLNVPGGNALTKQVLKDTTSGQAVESAYKTAIKTGSKEAVSEGLEAGAIEGAVQKIIDPNADLNWKDIVSTGMLESIYGGGHSTVIAGADATLNNISQRLANVGVTQPEIDLIRKGIAESVYDGGTTLKQDRETVANYLMDRYGYTEQTAQALSNAMVDATAQVTVNSFLTDAGLDSAKIAQVSPLVLNAINTGGDINTVAQEVSSVLQNAGIEAQNALNYTKAFLPTAKVTTDTGATITTPTVQVTKPADLTSVVTPAGGTNTAGDSTNVGGTTGSTTTTTGATTSTTGGATTGAGPTIVSTQTLANGNTSVTYSDGKVAVFDRTGTPVTSVDTSTTTGGGNVAVTADLNAVADALADLNKAVSTAQQGNTDSFSAINQAISDLKASGLTTDQVQNLIDTSVQSTNSALATAISEANKGNAQALTDLQTNINTKIDDLVKAGSTQAEATAKALSDLGISISDVSTGLETKIGDLSTDVQSKFDSMSEAQKALVETQVQQGKDLTQAINDVSTNLSSELKTGLAELSTDVTSKFDALSEAQKSEVAARVQMGEDINSAINDVSTKLESSISDLSTDVETKFDALSQSQTEMGTQFNTRVDELVEQGKTYQEATDLALKEINADITGISTDMARQEAGRRIAQKAAAEKSAKEKGLAAATALVSTAAEGSTDQDPAKFKKPFQTTGEGEKFEGPLEKFLKQARQGSFVPDEGKQGKQVPITEVTDRLERPQGQPAQQDGYYNYGQASDIDQILNPDSVNESLFQKDTLGAKAGGLMSTPLMATGGSMTGTRYGQYAGGGLNVVHHSGKARVDFRRGDAVTGPGDGQSDDIPAMLADGEFVIPADVVAALGNGSTKAGSDKLYDMMHSVRAYHRSAKPKDLPPPAKKSPLDYLKDTKRKARG